MTADNTRLVKPEVDRNKSYAKLKDHLRLEAP